jgi:hypothetical protein
MSSALARSSTRKLKSSSPPTTNRGVSIRPPSVLLALATRRAQGGRSLVVAAGATSRREALGVLGAGAAQLLLLGGGGAGAAQASGETAAAAPPAPTTTSSTTFEDAADGFTLAVPAGWATGEGSLSGNSSFSGATGSRRAVAFYEKGDPSTSCVVVVGNTSAEFTKMSSFGTATTFGSALVNSMDRSNLLRAPGWVRAKEAGPGGSVQVARLLDAKEVPVPGASGGGVGYFTDYTVTQVFPEGTKSPAPAPGADGTAANPTGPTAGGRRLLSVAALHTTPKGFRRIVTVTAQTPRGVEGEEARVAALREIVGSFRIVE